MRRLQFLLLSLLTLVALPDVARAAHPFGVDDMLALKRLGGFDLSPDGKWVAYAVTSVGEDYKTHASIWLAPLGPLATTGPSVPSSPRQLTQGHKRDREPRFSPDGKTLAFISDRDGEPQVYLIDLEGGEARPLTHSALGVESFTWSPDGKFLVYAAMVYPECTNGDVEACTRDRAERIKKAPSSGRVVERLLYRHWDTWQEGRRSHLLRIERTGGTARDLTPGNFDAPYFSLGGAAGYDISPDGKTLVYASNHDKVEAISTNSDLWEMSSSGGPARCLTCDNPAFDGSPHFSPDGRYVAFRSQRVPGYESDRFELRVYDRKAQKIRPLTADFDQWVEDYTWSPDSRRLYFVAPEKARQPIFSVAIEGGPVTPETPDTKASAADLHMLGGRASAPTLIYVETSLTQPAELVRRVLGPGGQASKPPERVTHLNDSALAAVTMGEVRERWVTSTDGTKVHALMVLPPGADEKKKYPALMWVHGGPQGGWQYAWSYRWNPQVLAAAGYVVYLPNPRGSYGYGQAFVRGVSGDWGGKVYDDLMRGADDLESLPFVDKGRIGAAGASFGGFMMNWFQGHTTRFKALFCHDGIANQEAMYATEEMWFPEFEFQGKPWDSQLYRKWSPMTAADKFKTPELIVHGEKDYRIPVEQAYLMYALLQRQGVPSKLLLFPDENHWVLKPANSRLWYATMIDWFHEYLGGAPADPKLLDTAASVTR
jgi:dipeptidyl aminopeptidase/acylaminoacyl peptidase